MLPLEVWVRGAQLVLDGSLWESRFRDPLTGKTRRDGTPSREFSFEFRQDVTALRSSWGVNYTAHVTTDLFYNREHVTERHQREGVLFSLTLSRPL